jgi:hypothetical protein
MRLAPLSFLVVLAALVTGETALAQTLPPRPPRDVDQPQLLPPSPRDNDLLQPLPQEQQRPRQVRPPAGVESTPLPPPGQIAQPPKQQPQPPQARPAAPANPPLRGPQPGGQVKQRPGERQPVYDSEVKVEQPPEQKIANPTVTFSGLDKITGRIITFDVAVNETVQFGPLQVTPRVCYTRPPTETQNTTSFVEVDEITLKSEIRRIFTGWMFASSPGMHAVEHPIYDVWLIDCKTTPPAIAASGKQ